MQKQLHRSPSVSTFPTEARLSVSLFSIRGLAILLVIIGHVIGERDSGIRQLYSADLSWLDWLYDFIYTFHMPIFFVASGLAFAVFSYSKIGNLKQFALGRLSRLVMPLLCWAPLYYGLRCVTGQASFSWAGLVQTVIYPDFIFWFFHSLLLISLFSYLALRYSSAPIYIISSIVLFAVSFLADGILPMTLYFNLFYALGFLLGLKLKQTYELPLLKLTAIQRLAIGGLVFLVMLLVFVGLKDNQYSLAKSINGGLGFLLLYLISLAVQPSRWHQTELPRPRPVYQQIKTSLALGLIHLGKISMSIYLLHVMFGSAARLVLVKLGVLAPGWHLVIGYLVALCGSVAADAGLRRSRLYLVSIGEAR
jgi:fucose 4-O-acetylase-like acetyltransferase